MAAPPGASSAKDPICGKPVDPLRARAVGIFGGVTYYFCSPECKAQFRDPRQSDRRARPAAAAPVANSTPAKLPALQPELFPPASPSPTLETWAAGAPPAEEAPDEGAASQPAASPSIVADLAAAKPRRGPWLMVAIVAMLGAVVFFTLRYFGKL